MAVIQLALANARTISPLIAAPFCTSLKNHILSA
jgi:hypothetical protein